jgi:hypothetical protein
VAGLYFQFCVVAVLLVPITIFGIASVSGLRISRTAFGSPSKEIFWNALALEVLELLFKLLLIFVLEPLELLELTELFGFAELVIDDEIIFVLETKAVEVVEDEFDLELEEILAVVILDVEMAELAAEITELGDAVWAWALILFSSPRLRMRFDIPACC